MKKLLSVLLTVIILIVGITPSMAIAENGYDKKLEEAIVKVKKLFNISDDYDKFTSDVNSYDGKTDFYLNWVDSRGKLDNINVNVDIDGNINSYGIYSSIYKEPSSKLPTYTKNEAEKLAMDFVAKIDPTIAKSIKLIPNEYPISSMDTQYYFDYSRYVNGIQYSQNTVGISVDKFSGEVVNYYTNWERDAIFPSPEKAINLDNGKESFKTEIGIKPIYKANNYYRPVDTNSEDKNNYYLAYSTIGANKGIDAFTGKAVNINYYGPFYGITANEKAMDAGYSEGITPEEQKSIDKLSGLLDEKTAEKKAREILKIDETYKLRSKNLNSNYKNQGEYNWYMYFSREESDKDYSNIDIGLDARTGELLNFYRMINYKADAKSKINREEAIKIAQEYIKKIQADKANQVELNEDQFSEDNQLSYYFTFNRKSDNIYVENDGIYIGIDGVGGEVTSYTLDWFKGKLPAKDKLIPIDKAYEVLWNEIGLQLMYVKTYDYTKPEGQNNEIKLVYSTNPIKPVIISGLTGELLDYSGQPYRETKRISYNDIENSYAKDKIKTLAEYGIGFEGEEFKPKEKIKQKDFVYLLWKSMNQYRTDAVSEDDIYNQMISMGYMKETEKSPDKVVTKEEAVKYIIRLMKLDKVAELDGIYKDIFNDQKDISKELNGYMNIAYGLKIVSGDEKGNIKAKYELKREDAANMIYNYLFN
ncbi:YcdB/YcdC domain-containing protein [Tissierella sp.]|uniref:YcdB/YcdC domain-containing protein n=1 Tax=Tissierella sp. TaxID=41274 RepID=UPI00286334DA|nr:YcdB/YcdC domain-containing protein [Tissierella sp.]MDR7857733.1 S-layer homology domain-containing protein [Tissierella sp.]